VVAAIEKLRDLLEESPLVETESRDRSTDTGLGVDTADCDSAE